MALGKRYSKSVVLISGSLEAGTAPTLRGTGFLSAIRLGDPNQALIYVVTAAHVVRPLAESFIKLGRTDGSVINHAVAEWVFHPTEDIAVIRLEGPYDGYEFVPVEVNDFVGTVEVEHQPGPGDDVYFAGLLAQVPSMGAQNIPMVRKGAIGALYQEGIPMRMPSNTFIQVNGHLVDCQSFGGFSGSPCFVRYLSATGQTEHLGLSYPVESTPLLGMVGGHFDLKASVELPDQENAMKIPVAAGVAVVYPAETIREALDLEPLAEERAKINVELTASSGDEP